MSAEADRDPPEPERPRKKKKKKRKRKPDAAAAPETRPQTAVDPTRARFLESFPRDPELDRLVAAFVAGDYASVRSGAPRLAEQTDDPSVRDAALELRRRIEPDPLIRYMLIASVGLLLFMIFYFYSQRP